MLNVAYFPLIFEDEILYSAIARLGELMAFPCIDDVNMYLFGKRNIVATLEFPYELESFASATSSVLKQSTEEIIFKNSFLPYYAPFIPENRLKTIITGMKNGNGSKSYSRSGFMASSISRIKKLKYCQGCCKEDREKYGEAYWHRLHQIQGVFVCPHHNELLIESEVNISNRRNRHLYKTAEQASNTFQEIQQNNQSKYLSNPIYRIIAEDIAWLLKQRIGTYTIYKLYEQYSYVLKDLGFAYPVSGRIKMKELNQDFLQYYGDDVLDDFLCGLNEKITENWLCRLVRSCNEIHNPLRHILLIHYFGFSLSSFLNMEIKINKSVIAFPCLNPVCSNYSIKKITDYKIRQSKYAPHNRYYFVECNCGFSYEINETEFKNLEIQPHKKVICYGKLWEAELIKLWNLPSISLRAIAHLLKVDPVTVRRKGELLGLPTSKFSDFYIKNPRLPHNRQNIDLGCQRIKWLGYLNQEQKFNIKDIRKIDNALYTWLYRHDKEWLMRNHPNILIVYSCRNRINWDNRDNELCSRIPSIVKKIKIEEGKPKKITKSSIGVELECLQLINKHPEKIPKTVEAIKSNIETNLEFAYRRLCWVAATNNEIVTSKWNLIRKSGIGRYLTNEIIIEKLQRIMDN